jgi:hypothetical protein
MSEEKIITIPSKDLEILAKLKTLNSSISKPVELLINSRICETVNFTTYCKFLGINSEESESSKIIIHSIADKGFVEAFKNVNPADLAFMIEREISFKRGVEKKQESP